MQLTNISSFVDISLISSINTNETISYTQNQSQEDDNEDKVSISGIQKNSQYSHNRFQARMAYLNQGQKADDKKEDEQNTDPNELTEAEEKQVEKLKKTDTEVHIHEQAHQRAGGQYASAPSYETKKGPDGKDYAVAGHVNIDVNEENTPEKTIKKMQVVIKAANAPAKPSSQDMKVAAEAKQIMNKAQLEKNNEDKNELNSNEEPKKTNKK